MSILERCPSYRESNKGSKERQGPTLSVNRDVCLVEVSVKRESTVETIPAEKGTVESDSSELICKDVFE